MRIRVWFRQGREMSGVEKEGIGCGCEKSHPIDGVYGRESIERRAIKRDLSLDESFVWIRHLFTSCKTWKDVETDCTNSSGCKQNLIMTRETVRRSAQLIAGCIMSHGEGGVLSLSQVK